MAASVVGRLVLLCLVGAVAERMRLISHSRQERGTVLKLPLRTFPKSTGSSFLNLKHSGLDEQAKQAFTEEECEQMQAQAAKLKAPTYDSLELCRNFREVSPDSAGVELNRVSQVKTRRDGTSLADTFRLFTNDKLVDIVMPVLRENTIQGTSTFSGEERNYADVIKAMLRSNIKVYIIGGFARDFVRGIPANDVDIGFNCTPEHLTEVLRSTLGISMSSYVPGVGEELLAVPGSYFKFGSNDTQIEGKPDDTNAYAQFLQTDFAMNTLAMDMQCVLGNAPCYVMDKTGVGLQHSLSGILDLPTPGGATHADAEDFNDWLAFQCAVSAWQPCAGAFRYLKFLARGWAPTPLLEQMIVPSIRVLLAHADQGFEWKDFHEARRAANLPSLFQQRRGPAPNFLPLSDREATDMSPDVSRGVMAYMDKAGAGTRLATMQKGIKVANIIWDQMDKKSDPDDLCEALSWFCLPKLQVFSSLIAWRMTTYTGVHLGSGIGHFTPHPCGEMPKKFQSRAAGWYYWYKQTWQKVDFSTLPDVRSSDGGKTCPAGLLAEKDLKLRPLSLSWHDGLFGIQLGSADVCYVPHGPTDPLLLGMLHC